MVTAILPGAALIAAITMFSGCIPTGDPPGEGADLTNRLSGETSPYLLQHADNPVNWQPWGEEAFETARQLDRPIFLSIGYSSCHWCHVMEEESFEDEEVAALLNDSFICVKVDREERPDVDAVYMRYALAMTGRGGWPLTIVMTPEAEPFFAATYLPKHTSRGMTGMMELLPALTAEWNGGREGLEDLASRVSAAVSFSASSTGPGGGISPESIEQCFQTLHASFDSEHGGFGSAPKFPSPHTILFLLRYWSDTGENSALDMAASTMRAMRAGGVYDQVGYGLHRYSTDEMWLVPHFEKMLYDQALFTLAALETYEATGDPSFREMAEATIEYVLRDMRSPEGVFYSSEDADSGEGEGEFYTWTIEEIDLLLGPVIGADATEYWGLTPEGNFSETGRPSDGACVLHIAAGASGLDHGPQWMEDAVPTLLEAKRSRPRPFRDEKILTDWNGLMIAALARAARVLDRPELLEISEEAFRLVVGGTGGDVPELSHSRILSEVPGNGAFLDDFAFMIRAALELYRSSFDPDHLRWAMALQLELDTRFRAPGGGYYFNPDDGDPSVPRFIETYDGAIPSGNSMELWNLTELWRLTGEQGYLSSAEGIEAAFSGAVSSSPSGHAMMLSHPGAAGHGEDIVITGERDDPIVAGMLGVLEEGYHPRRTVLLIGTGGDTAAPEWLPRVALQGGPAAYVCREGACLLPVDTVSGLEELLGAL